MALGAYTGKEVSLSDISFGGGLNTTAGNLNLKDNEASDLQNVDFNIFGSFLKRNGYAHVNSTAIPNTPEGDGLHWFEYDSGGTLTRTAMAIADGKAWKMDNLDGTWDNISETQAVVFTGAGLNDATSSGTYTGNGDIEYKVVIDATGTPDTFEWFKDSVSQAAGVAITGAAQLLDNGLSITFAATTGHTLSNQWVFHPAVTITATNHVDFETLVGTTFMTNGVNIPWKWTGSGNVKLMNVPTGLTSAKFIKSYNNYMFLANVTISGIKYRTRIYWSTIQNPGIWDSADFLEIGLNDGQEITGLRVLADRLVVYKERSIWNVFFTGDPDIPFAMPGGGKSNSSVGCISGFSIQDVMNGHFFLSYDGIYMYDGDNSWKVSDRLNVTINSFNKTRLYKCVSMNQKSKNRYWIGMTTESGTQNDIVLAYDYTLQAFTKYSGMKPASMAMFYVGGSEERPYFLDYSGYLYRADTGANDYPLKVKTAINGYYKTNWRSFGDLINQKGIPQITLYYKQSDSILTLGYSYDFEDGDQYSGIINISAGGNLWDVAAWDEGVWVGSGGGVIRRDLTGRGRVARITFSNNNLDETFQIDGMGTGAYLETNA